MVRTRSPITDDPRITDYGRFVEAQRHLNSVFDKSLRTQVGISIVWYEALIRLARSEDRVLPINELGRAMNLTSGGATRLVDRLESAGYIERTSCPTDRRVSWIRLTDAGTKITEQATRMHLADLHEHFGSRLSEDEIASLSHIMDRLRV
ncbi:MAG: MarR family transcriptional regulator [Acidimicrobiia bacterium]|nr:MarR family transcriptional regulator [Acidimicrobiia bacterium]